LENGRFFILEQIEKNEEKQGLTALADMEDLAEKKTKIYSRILMDPALAKAMEEISLRHEKRKEGLLALALGKQSNKKNKQGMDEMNEKETEE
jgi:hypothetical protein